eukprot:gene787-9037_t
MDAVENYKQGDISSSLFGESEKIHEENEKFFVEPTEEEKREIEKKYEAIKNKKRTRNTFEEAEEKKKKIEEDIAEKNKRSIFVGNINFEDHDTEKVQNSLEQLFSQFGKVQSVRLRSIPIAQDLKLPRKAAVIKEKFAETKKSVNAYVVFKEAESCKQALEVNGQKIDGRHLIVDLAVPDKMKNSDHKKTVFLGNLPFDADEEEIWKIFEKKRLKVTKVRVIRDVHNSVGKGFGYVTFEDQENAKKAVGYKGAMKIRDRMLRISHSDRNAKEKKETKEKNKKAKEDEKLQTSKSKNTNSSGKKEFVKKEEKKLWTVVNDFKNGAVDGESGEPKLKKKKFDDKKKPENKKKFDKKDSKKSKK